MSRIYLGEILHRFKASIPAKCSVCGKEWEEGALVYTLTDRNNRVFQCANKACVEQHLELSPDELKIFRHHHSDKRYLVTEHRNSFDIINGKLEPIEEIYRVWYLQDGFVENLRGKFYFDYDDRGNISIFRNGKLMITIPIKIREIMDLAEFIKLFR